MRNIKLIIEYDGTNFHGWQEQPGLRTVQGQIQQALQQIFSKNINVFGAGRTDTGVHARAQVANFRIEHDMPVLTIIAALNGNLPKDVRIISAEEVPLDFHARYNAIKRQYCYRITQRETAINRFYMWHFKARLDLEKMQRASNFLIGEQDFKAFCQTEKDEKHYRCCVELIKWEQNAEVIMLNIIANRFLHSMVRVIVGTMINVGRGYTSIDQIPQILHSRDRRNAGPTVPAKGLCLEKVYY